MLKRVPLSVPPHPQPVDPVMGLAATNMKAVAVWWEANCQTEKPYALAHEQARALYLAARGQEWEAPQ